MKNLFIPLLSISCLFCAPMAFANGGTALAHNTYSIPGTNNSLMFDALFKYTHYILNNPNNENEAEHARGMVDAHFALTQLIKRNNDDCINDRQHHADSACSPLYFLVREGQVELVKLALEHGANPMDPFVGFDVSAPEPNDSVYYAKEVLASEDPKVQEGIRLMKEAQTAWRQKYELLYTLSDYIYLKKFQRAPYGTKDLSVDNAKEKILKLIQDSPVAKLNETHFIDDDELTLGSSTTITTPLKLALELNDRDILHALLKHGAIPTDEKTGILDEYQRTLLFLLTKSVNNPAPNERLDIATDYYRAQLAYYKGNPPQDLTPVEAMCHYAWMHSLETWMQYRAGACSYQDFIEAQAIYLDLNTKLYKDDPKHSRHYHNAKYALTKINGVVQNKLINEQKSPKQ